MTIFLQAALIISCIFKHGSSKWPYLQGVDLKSKLQHDFARVSACVVCEDDPNRKLCIFQLVEDLGSCAGSATTLLNSNEGRSMVNRIVSCFHFFTRFRLHSQFFCSWFDGI